MVSAGGVKGLKAKAELEQMRSQDKTEQNRRAIKGAAAQRQAQKLVHRGSMGASSSNLQADAIKARIMASITERMAKLAKQEQERANALAAQFDGAFAEADAEEDKQEEVEENAAELIEEQQEFGNDNNKLIEEEKARIEAEEQEEQERQRVEQEREREEQLKREDEKRIQVLVVCGRDYKKG
jgi:hypothetical protein